MDAVTPRPKDSLRTRLRPSGWTLRRRLLVSLLAVMALVCLVIGSVSVVSLNAFLQGRLDDSLRSAVNRSRNFDPDAQEAPRPTTGQGRRFGIPPGQAVGTVQAFVSNGAVTNALMLNEDGQEVTLEAPELLAATPVDKEPHTRDLGGSLGEYRLIAESRLDGTVLVTGLPLQPVHTAVGRLAAVIIGISLVGLLLAGLLGALIVRLSLRPLNRVVATATRVSELPLHSGEVALAERVDAADTDPRTEVGQVGAALNRLLGHVGSALTARQASETRVRQFVADASHELRTPLAAIRGYAELTRRSPEPVPDDVAHALRRVESESIRMTGLVEDLLLLARLDSGRPIDREPVDLTSLTVDTVSDARAAGPDHAWQLELPDEPVTVQGDAFRLHQVLANLLSNARTHTPVGTAVTVSLTREDGFAVLRVADNGPGIPADLQADVFERFARGESSRSRAAGSTGLGLAIAAAVVAAHDGTVDVSSKPGRTEFTVRLPRD